MLLIHTKYRITQASSQLIKTKPIAEITKDSIIEASQITPAEFEKYYEDQYDVLLEVLPALLGNPFLQATLTNEGFIEQFSSWIEKNKLILANCLLGNESFEFYRHFIGMMGSLLNKAHASQPNITQIAILNHVLCSANPVLSTELFSQSLLGIINVALENDLSLAAIEQSMKEVFPIY
jgi:hypothetical protein